MLRQGICGLQFFRHDGNRAGCPTIQKVRRARRSRPTDGGRSVCGGEGKARAQRARLQQKRDPSCRNWRFEDRRFQTMAA